MNREQTIRDAAYAIWEAEGRPAGRDQNHWLQAERQVADSVKPAAKQKAPAVPQQTEKATAKKPVRTKKA